MFSYDGDGEFGGTDLLNDAGGTSEVACLGDMFSYDGDGELGGADPCDGIDVRLGQFECAGSHSDSDLDSTGSESVSRSGADASNMLTVSNGTSESSS